jgi:hypothetical protein
LDEGTSYRDGISASFAEYNSAVLEIHPHSKIQAQLVPQIEPGSRTY